MPFDTLSMYLDNQSRLTTMQVGGTTGTMSWFSRGAMRNQYETGAIKATYSYTDINNNLRVAQDAAGLTTSTYDGDNLRRKIVAGSLTTTFVWDGADYLQIKPSTGDATLLIVLEGEVVGHVKGSEKRDYIVDPLGSVVAYLNSSQALTDQFEYWPYGELIAEIEAGTEPFLWVGSLGYFRDSDLRTYIRAREYRQDLGSWMQLDPLWSDEPALAYGYSSPITWIDPRGLQRQIIPRRGTIDEGIVGLNAGICLAKCILPDPPSLLSCIKKGKKHFEKWVEEEWLKEVGRKHGSKVVVELREAISRFKKVKGLGKSWTCVLACFAEAWADTQERKGNIYPWQTCGLMEDEGECVLCCARRGGANRSYCASMCIGL